MGKGAGAREGEEGEGGPIASGGKKRHGIHECGAPSVTHRPSNAPMFEQVTTK